MAKCKGCGREIIWIETVAGKKMSCDPVIQTYWLKKNGSKKIITPNGEVVSAETNGELGRAAGLGYTSHYATCPCADRFRKRQVKTP